MKYTECISLSEIMNQMDDNPGLVSIYGWVRSQPMKEGVTYVTYSLIGWGIAQP